MRLIWRNRAQHPGFLCGCRSQVLESSTDRLALVPLAIFYHHFFLTPFFVSKLDFKFANYYGIHRAVFSNSTRKDFATLIIIITLVFTTLRSLHSLIWGCFSKNYRYRPVYHQPFRLLIMILLYHYSFWEDYYSCHPLISDSSSDCPFFELELNLD